MARTIRCQTAHQNSYPYYFLLSSVKSLWAHCDCQVSNQMTNTADEVKPNNPSHQDWKFTQAFKGFLAHIAHLNTYARKKMIPCHHGGFCWKIKSCSCQSITVDSQWVVNLCTVENKKYFSLSLSLSRLLSYVCISVHFFLQLTVYPPETHGSSSACLPGWVFFWCHVVGKWEDADRDCLWGYYECWKLQHAKEACSSTFLFYLDLVAEHGERGHPLVRHQSKAGCCFLERKETEQCHHLFGESDIERQDCAIK